ncbi:hypothetical protein NOCARDAX2BIS_640004 [Nocardioides sp. AX2bis]|nr:hypothetical protein NOCARDAX2BIS_640004 [Nocardioides sp. AX2bis]
MRRSSWIDPSQVPTLEGPARTPTRRATTMTTTSATSRLLRRLDGWTLWAFNADASLGGRRRTR